MSRQTLAVATRKIWIPVIVTGLLAALGLTTRADVADLSYSAASFGLNPSISLDQGSASGVADGNLYDWTNNIPTSPRNTSNTSISPYITWSTPQTISSVRIWDDLAGLVPNNLYDSVSISVLNTGGDPTNLSDWTQVYTTGTGLNKTYTDLSLGGNYTTEGLRVTATKATADINVGEIAAFGPLRSGGTLTDHLATPTGAVASSTEFGRVASNGIDGVWSSSSLSQVAASDPSVAANGYFTYDISYDDAALDALEISWGFQAGYADVPAHWTIQYEQGGVFHDIGTFDKVGVESDPRIMNYVDLDSITGQLQNVQDIRLLVYAADEPTGRLSVGEFEAFSLPEPASLGLLTVGVGSMLLRRRRG